MKTTSPDWLQRHSPQTWPEEFDDMLDCIDLCDNVDDLRFHHEWGEEWFVEFKFCGHTLSFRALDEGDGYGPFGGYHVYALRTSEDVMFWIACELAGRLDRRRAKLWRVKFTATRGDMVGKIKMGAIGETWEEACQFVRDHCAGQYDSMGEITEIPDRD